MNNSKRHHVVPIMLLGRFTAAYAHTSNHERVDRGGILYFFDRMHPFRGVKSTCPKNLFVRKKFHSQHDEKGNIDNSAESKFSNIEGKASDVFRRIILAGHSNRIPNLTEQEKINLDNFIYHQWKRTPEFIEQNIPSAKIELEYRKAIEDSKKGNFIISPELAEKLADESFVAREIENLRVKCMIEACTESSKRLANTGIMIYRNNCEFEKFIIGSNPVLIRPVDENLFTTILPLSLNIAIRYTLKKNQEGFELITTPSTIRKINDHIAAQSNVIAGYSRDQINMIGMGCSHFDSHN